MSYFLAGASQKVSGSVFEALGVPQKVSGSTFYALGTSQKVSGSTFEALGASQKAFSLRAEINPPEEVSLYTLIAFPKKCNVVVSIVMKRYG